MTRWTRWALAAALVVLPMLPADAAAPTPSAHERKVRELLELTGAGDMGKQTMDAMLAQFQGMPGLPPGFVEEFKAVAQPSQLVDLIVPIYMRNLSEADVDAAIVFYKSPAGMRWSKAMPTIMSESMQAGQAWGGQLGQQVMTNLMQKGGAPK
jgi:hypothetical protein